MRRRGIIGIIAVSTALSVSIAQAGDAAIEQAKVMGQAQQKYAGVNKHPDAQWFPEAGLGLFIHWGIAAVKAKGDISWTMMANKPWSDGTMTPNEYYASIKDWHPDKMNYDRMLGAAKAAGFNYAVMVTKHHDGFALWPSAYGDLGTKYSFHGRDFVKEFVSACRKHGLKVGLYYSPEDWWVDRPYRTWDFKGPALDMDHKPFTPPKRPADHDQKRRNYNRAQLTELLTKYGKIDLMWFDWGSGEMSDAEVRKLQPGIVINSRNGPGDYGHDEGRTPSGRFNGWFESCIPCWPKRMWSYREPTEYGGYDAAMTLTMLVTLRARGANLLANVGPKAEGTVPESALACWSDMAQWMKHSRESVFGTLPGPWPEQVNLPVTRRDGMAYIHFLPKLPDKLTDIPAGERDFTQTRQVIPALPKYTDTVVWKNAPAPAKVTLLRTGEQIPFTYESGILTVALPPQLRTANVDVVKIELAKP
jgi:alpha-L-fucosidase